VPTDLSLLGRGRDWHTDTVAVYIIKRRGERPRSCSELTRAWNYSLIFFHDICSFLFINNRVLFNRRQTLIAKNELISRLEAKG